VFYSAVNAAFFEFAGLLCPRSIIEGASRIPGMHSHGKAKLTCRQLPLVRIIAISDKAILVRGYLRAWKHKSNPCDVREQMAFSLSEVAAEELKKAYNEASFGPETFVRIGVMGGGCAGFQYSLQFDDKYDDEKDSRYEQHGVSYVVDKKSSLLLDGAMLGYHKSLERQGFTFENPNAVKSCGCGKSFQ
jgi:iron-sulfur cluster assembly accessory protein